MTRTTHIPSTDMAFLVARGRRLQGRAVRDGFRQLALWLYRTVSGAVGRRAAVRLGCSDCGAHA